MKEERVDEMKLALKRHAILHPLSGAMVSLERALEEAARTCPTLEKLHKRIAGAWKQVNQIHCDFVLSWCDEEIERTKQGEKKTEKGEP